MRVLLLGITLFAFGCGTDGGPDLFGSLQAGVGRGVFINEILANEPAMDTSGEFIELVNASGEPVDLAGWSLSDAYAVRHTFGPGTVLEPGRALVVSGAQSHLALTNGGDTVTLRDGAGAVEDSVTYTRSLGGVDGVSMNRSPDGEPDAAFVLHTALTSSTSSPGLRADGRPFAPEDANVTSTSVRIVAANLTSGTQQSYTPGEGIRILQGLDADVALVQEFNYGGNTDAELRAFVDAAFGPEFFYVRESDRQIPNGVVSRWPIVATGTWDDPSTTSATRDFIWARIDLPGDRDLWAVSVHLLTANATTRDHEAVELVRQVKALVPEGDLLTVGGDLNTGWTGEYCLTTLSQVVTIEGPHPVDAYGNGNTNAGRTRPYDWVLADADLERFRVPTVVGGQTFEHGLVFDSRTFSPLEAVAPVLSGDSGAPYMQHMAVVKDFHIDG